MEDHEYTYLKTRILQLTGIDLNSYKAPQMRRRLDNFLARFPGSSVVTYCRYLEQDPSALQKLKDFLTINVSEFFRDPEQFQALKTRVIPELLKSGPSLNVWSAGCSIGAEPYTLAMIMDGLVPKITYKVLATDLDQQVLARARAGGPYSDADIKNVPQSLRQKYFNQRDSGYHVVDQLRSKITFRQQNLLKDSFDRGFDLIVCRNVVIYFSDEAKSQLNRKFRDSLKEGGVLFIGGTETLFEGQNLGLSRVHPSFYRKMPAAAPGDIKAGERPGRTPSKV